MEFENVNEQMEWDRKRVGAAFGVTEWETYFGGSNEHGEVVWSFNFENKRLWMIDVGESTEDSWRGCKVFRLCDERWEVRMFQAHSHHRTCMAHGLYRLGFEDESVLAALPRLSAHEKLELRLSMPHEFWPKTWLQGMEDGT